MVGTADDLRFETARLVVDPWHIAAEAHKLDLNAQVRALLTRSTTASLPAEWQGEYSAQRAQHWIDERDAESPTLLVMDRTTDEMVGLVILYFVDRLDEPDAVDVQVGYVLRESVWGRGLATELVGGLVSWAQAHPTITTLVAGVDPGHEASVRVLVKNGFARAETTSNNEHSYLLGVRQPPAK